MDNYKEMYLKLFHATEDAINRLIKAQRECEELYLSAGDNEESPLSPLEDCAES